MGGRGNEEGTRRARNMTYLVVYVKPVAQRTRDRIADVSVLV